MTAHDTIDPDALRLAGTLLLMVRELDHQVRQVGSDELLSVTDLSVMRQIESGNDLPSLVARALRLDPGRVTRITDTLVSLGYVDRREDEEDRRRCRLTLTSTGLQRLKVGQAAVSSAMNHLLGDLTPEERDDLAIGIECVRRVLDTTSRSAALVASSGPPAPV
ncbi:MAG: MarR family winged helix-turn-helix transcriptional regulator [Chloroflexota bacterium]|nr:MarR family winged helix-turn-helix transcriptional regulator [Chloroflexota bacterium]